VLKFELQISWTMTATLELDAESEEDATCYALNNARRVTDGSFVPFSMNVDSISAIKSTQRLLIVK
jgi:hypothetical protein